MKSIRPGWEIQPAPRDRTWMDETPNRFAYRCLPLLIANQAGWVITCPVGFTVWWKGYGRANKAMSFKFDEDPGIYSQNISSHFGSGILTFTIPFLFRTPENIQLSVRGLPNSPKTNCSPLEGIVESSWSPFTFTMNWKLHLPFFPVRFKKFEPICFIQPISLAALEDIQPVLEPISANPDINRQHSEWAEKREIFNAQEAHSGGWQKHYFQGKTTDGDKTDSVHRTQVNIRPFTRQPL